MNIFIVEETPYRSGEYNVDCNVVRITLDVDTKYYRRFHRLVDDINEGKPEKIKVELDTKEADRLITAILKKYGLERG